MEQIKKPNEEVIVLNSFICDKRIVYLIEIKLSYSNKSCKYLAMVDNQYVYITSRINDSIEINNITLIGEWYCYINDDNTEEHNFAWTQFKPHVLEAINLYASSYLLK